MINLNCLSLEPLQLLANVVDHIACLQDQSWHFGPQLPNFGDSIGIPLRVVDESPQL